LPGPDAQDGPLSLVTDTGRRYAIPTTDALRALGLAGAHTSKLPASLVVRIPEGQPLDQAAARAALQQEQQAN
jgi:ESX secretion system ATPase EccB